MTTSSPERRRNQKPWKGNPGSRSIKKWLRFSPLLFTMVIYLPGMLGRIPYPSSLAEYTDLLISHYPNALYLKRSVIEFGQIPLWSPLIFSGYPFAANPLSGLWYPPGWLALLCPLPHGLSILLALHALWGSVGMYRLLREEELSHAPALFGGIAWGLMPKISAHYGAGHVTLCYAMAWTPWLLFAARRKKRVVWSSLCMAAIFLADPRWAAFSGMLWAGHIIAHSHYKMRKMALDIGKTIILSGLLASPLIIPLLQYVSLSTRRAMSPDEVFTHSTSAIDFIGLFFPSAGRTVESAMYPGGLILIMAILAMGAKKIRKQTSFWWITAGISALVALGSNVPGLKYVAYLPGLSLLRVPSRSLFILSMSLIIIACYLLKDMMSVAFKMGRASYTITAVGFFVVLLLTGIGYLGESFPISIMWGMGSITLGVLVLNLRNKSLLREWWLPLLFILLMVDGVGAGRINIDFRSANDGKRMAEFVQESRDGYGYFRTYSPSYSIPQHVAAKDYIEMADGVDPLQLESYVTFMESATGIPSPGYSVTIPPFPGDPSQVNKGYQPDLELLGLLNVRYLVSAFKIPIDGATLIKKEKGLYVYQNPEALPRAWVQDLKAPITVEGISAEGMDWEKAEIREWRSNKIVVDAKGPGKVVLSEIAYPGWEVNVDGQDELWAPVYGILRGVDIPQGEHRIEFVYRPKSVYLGLICFLVGSVAMIRGISVDGKNR